MLNEKVTETKAQADKASEAELKNSGKCATDAGSNDAKSRANGENSAAKWSKKAAAKS